MVARSRSFFRWASALAMVAGTVAPASAGFTIRDMGLIVGTGTSGADGISASGEVAGVATCLAGTNVAVMSSGGGPQMLALPTNTYSVADSISGNGQMAGYFVDPNGVTHGFSSGGGAAATIKPMAGGTYTEATGINNGGQVVGVGDTTGGATRAFLATGGTAQAIAPLGSGGFNVAGGINDGGTVVGTSATSPGGLLHAFFTGPHGAVDLLMRNAAGNFAFNTYGTAIANNGDIVGYGDVGRGEHAFYASSRGGAMVDLGVLAGASSSQAMGVNNLATVVGQSSFGSGLSGPGGSGAFLWTSASGMVDLNTLLPPVDQSNWVLGAATGINDLDQVSGTGYLDGVLHGFILTPVVGESLFAPGYSGVPEPPALVLTILGAGIAAAWSRRHLIRRGRTGGRAAS